MGNQTAGNKVVEILKEWGVSHLYGMPGDSINELMEELRKDEDGLKYIQIRHEETGALAAAAYAKLTGRMGVCSSIAGPGGVHLLNGLYDAKRDKVPVLALVGQVDTTIIGTDNFQEIQLNQMFADVSVFNERVQSAAQLPDMLHQAIRAAYTEKGVAVLVIPDDVSAAEIKREAPISSGVFARPKIRPEKEDMVEAARLLDGAKKPVILAGKGARYSTEELLAFAEHIQAPVASTLLAKGVVPDEHEHSLGQNGQIGTTPSYEALQEADLLILAGTSFPYRDFMPKNTKAIQIDIDPRVIGKYYPVTVGLVSELGPVLQWYTENLERREPSAFMQKYKEKRKEWWSELEKDMTEETDRLQPPQVIHEVQQFLEEDAVVSVDVGNVTVWAARYLKLKRQEFVISGWMATMGCALPGAIAAKAAWPEKQTVMLAGDGGFAMGMQDFATAVKYQLPMICIVFNNEKIGMIEYEQQQMGHLDTETDISGIDFAGFAKACGGEGYRVRTKTELHEALQKAVLATRPVVIDCVVDMQPPLPGRISYQQAVHYSEFIIKNVFERGEVSLPPLKKGWKRIKK
ncbi:pyruvate oxidase [Marinococcus luteus]|uniref:pyruvate oxidase n=1 Tax=Marinococcus luteus TaxID=1122204 RepID=UPI002ACCA277|nr:pyruvate oxidase [Marinococcus luteus]MDZ5783684.1 pyruvate oxidase [Marinococcus luteus]